MSKARLLLRRLLQGFGISALSISILVYVGHFIACGPPMDGTCPNSPLWSALAWFNGNLWLALSIYATLCLLVVFAFRGELTTEFAAKIKPMSGPAFAVWAFALVALVLLGFHYPGMLDLPWWPPR